MCAHYTADRAPVEWAQPPAAAGPCAPAASVPAGPFPAAPETKRDDCAMLPRRNRENMTPGPATRSIRDSARSSRLWLRRGWYCWRLWRGSMSRARARTRNGSTGSRPAETRAGSSRGQTVYHNWHGDAPAKMLRRTSCRSTRPIWRCSTIRHLGSRLLHHRETVEHPAVAGAARGVGALFARYLPPLPATNLVLVVAFGYFVFKAGYAQPELLYYFLHS